jgi:hypothetical protein
VVERVSLLSLCINFLSTDLYNHSDNIVISKFTTPMTQVLILTDKWFIRKIL